MTPDTNNEVGPSGEDGAMPSATARAAGTNVPEPASRLGLSAASTIAPGTPLPWRVDDNGDDETEIVGNAGPGWRRFGVLGEWSVAKLDDLLCEHPELVRANARYIVHACNLFPELVEALEAARDEIARLRHGIDTDEWIDPGLAAAAGEPTSALASAASAERRAFVAPSKMVDPIGAVDAAIAKARGEQSS